MDIFTFRKATPHDLDLLVSLRLEVLRSANGLADSADLSHLASPSRQYYAQSFKNGGHITFLAFDRATGSLVGCGGMSDYAVLPTCCNPSGRKAYLMNLYTRPCYRRQGIARHLVRLLVQDAQARGITAISLEATAEGRPLYERCGFVPMPHEMELAGELQ